VPRQSRTTRAGQTVRGRCAIAPASRRRGFTLIDVLVSLGVIAVLIGILLPTLSRVRETTRKVLCASNVRQLGLGVAMYADDWHDRIPLSIYVTPMSSHIPRNASGGQASLVDTIDLRLNAPGLWGSPWDGLGRLYPSGYLPASGVFYCPSHTGDHPQSQYAEAWGLPSGRITGNYQYRGQGPRGETHLSRIEPKRSAIAADALFDAQAPNHPFGLNVLRTDISVSFVPDADGSMLRNFAVQGAQGGTGGSRAWETLDNTSGDNAGGSSSGSGVGGRGR